MTGKVLIDARNLVVSFESGRALDAVNLSASAGELVGVVGVSASGKTVLLKTLCGLLGADEGTLVVGDVDLRKCSRSELESLRRRVGFCFQNLALFDGLDVRENVAFSLLRRGVPGEEAREKASAQLKAVGLEAALEKYPHELSGGMKRRLALARAMVSEPEISLYDDPFVGLDPVACARIARLIAETHRRVGGVSLVAAGDPTPLLEVAHRMVLLEGGRVVADVPTSEFNAASNEYIARYLGSTP